METLEEILRGFFVCVKNFYRRGSGENLTRVDVPRGTCPTLVNKKVRSSGKKILVI
jgi:hypothetical protein